MRELTLLSIVTVVSFVLAGIALIITRHAISSPGWAIGVGTAVSMTVWAVAGILYARSVHKGTTNGDRPDPLSEVANSRLPDATSQQPGRTQPFMYAKHLYGHDDAGP